ISRPPVQCKECKELFPDKKSAREHGRITGHSAGTGYYCDECGFVGKWKKYRDHVPSTGHTRRVEHVPGSARGEHFTTQHELAVHRDTTQFQSPPRANECLVCGEETTTGEAHLECLDNPVCCPNCQRQFSTGAALAEHVKESSPCPRCNICTFRGRLAKHWLISMNHPKCYDCKLGFEDMSRWSQHKAICPTSLSLRSPKASRSEMKSDTGTAEASTPSVRFGADDPSTTVHDTASGPEADALSWHCRLCTGEVCIEPVVTVCGHIFCHGCIVQELGENMRCPVCKKAFFIRLHTRN
ncbi:hypothetical protein BD311DRAFT_647915, partial [Dichomitus squalens]